MDHGLRCWKCGVSLADYSLPLRRLEECRGCGAELHVCRMCEFYDTGVAKHCREPVLSERFLILLRGTHIGPRYYVVSNIGCLRSVHFLPSGIRDNISTSGYREFAPFKRLTLRPRR